MKQCGSIDPSKISIKKNKETALSHLKLGIVTTTTTTTTTNTNNNTNNNNNNNNNNNSLYKSRLGHNRCLFALFALYFRYV